MNYPIWDVSIIGSGLLIGFVSVLHAFISHFAIGGSLAWMLLGFVSAKPMSKVVTGIALITPTVICMVLIRDVVRDAYLDRYFDASRFPVETQTGVIILFFFFLIVGLGVLGYMVRKVASAR